MKIFRSPKEKLPKNESIIVWKKLAVEASFTSPQNLLCKLRIPARARRVEPRYSEGKCRAERAFVVSIEDIATGKKVKKGHSLYLPNFTYETGKMVVPLGFDGRKNMACSSGINFFKTKAEARRYEY